MQIKKLLSADSHAIGIYYDSTNNYYFILTKDLNMLFYNKATLTLERKGDFNDSSKMLCLESIINSIFTEGHVFQSKDLTEISMNDFDTFDKICEKKEIYMEFGKHKTLDYLNLSLNLPLNFNELSIYSVKYTKAFHDFLRIKPNLREIQTNEEKRKVMLRNLNNICYLNNHLYNSDANEIDFKRCGVNFIKAHIGTKSMRGNNQQIMMVNLRMIIKNLRKKFMNEVDETLANLEESQEFEEEQFDHQDEYKYIKRSSSVSKQDPQEIGFRRTVSKLAEGNDYEDFKGSSKLGIENKKRINKPKVMKVKGASPSSFHEKELFENNQ